MNVLLCEMIRVASQNGRCHMKSLIYSSLESMHVFGKIFRVHAKFFQRDWRAHANFGVHNLSNHPRVACSS